MDFAYVSCIDTGEYRIHCYSNTFHHILNKMIG